MLQLSQTRILTRKATTHFPPSPAPMPFLLLLLLQLRPTPIAPFSVCFSFFRCITLRNLTPYSTFSTQYPTLFLSLSLCIRLKPLSGMPFMDFYKYLLSHGEKEGEGEWTHIFYALPFRETQTDYHNGKWETYIFENDYYFITIPIELLIIGFLLLCHLFFLLTEHHTISLMSPSMEWVMFLFAFWQCYKQNEW